MNKIKYLLALMVFSSLVFSDGLPDPNTINVRPTNNMNMENPAASFCKKNGGTYKNETAADGSQSGVCVFADGSQCGDFAFLRGECKVGQCPKWSITTNSCEGAPTATNAQ